MENERSNGRASVAFPEPGAASKQQIFAESPFSGLPRESAEALLRGATWEQFPRRHVLTPQGEPPRALFLIGAGRVKIERAHGERALVLGHRGPGHVVGEAGLSGGSVATESASVVDEVAAVAIPMGLLRERLGADPALCAVVNALVVRQHEELERRLMGLLLHGVEARLASFLLGAGQRWGQPHADGELVSAAFTHAEMATLIGSTRETVTLVLGKLKREGVLGFDHRRVVIRDRARLEERASAPSR
jgi:CRP/FNR family transcriptional regulator, cyclic AMP receptor protein